MKKKFIIQINDEEATQENIVDALEKKLPVLKKLYKEAKNPICVSGKFLKDKEMEEIRELIKKEMDVTVEFDNINELGLYGIKKA